MAKRKTSLYCLLLLAVLILAGAVLSVGESQARYINTVVWNTYVEPAQEEPEDEKLCFTADQPLTVLLGEMKETNYPVQFSLLSREGAVGTLTWTADPALEIQMQLGDTLLEQNGSLELSADTPAKLVMIVKDLGEPRDAVTAQVAVTWTETIGESGTEQTPEAVTATFLVELPAVEAVPEESQPTEGEDPGNGETGEGSTEGGETGDGSTESGETGDGGTEGGETGDGGTEGGETGDGGTEGGETGEGSTESGETGDGSTEGGETGDGGTESGDTGDGSTEGGDTGDGNTEGEDPGNTEGEPEEPKPVQTILMDALPYFDPDRVIPVWITVENKATVELGFGYYLDAVSSAQMQPFPRYARFSADGGQSWFLLYKADTVTLEMESGTSSLLLDLSGAELVADTSLTLMAEGWSETTDPGQATAGVNPVTQPWTAASRIMTADLPLQIALTDQWPVSTDSNYGITYSFERLLVTGTAEEGYQKEYEPVIWAEAFPAEEEPAAEEAAPAEEEILAEEAVPAEEGSAPSEELPTEAPEPVPLLIAGVEAQTLTVRPGSTLPPPGTYRVNINWTYQGICISQKQVTFFINYPRITESAQTGGAEQ